MNKRENVTGYCPKQNKETTISVTYAVSHALKTDFIEPSNYYCEYSNTTETCTNCPIFEKLL